MHGPDRREARGSANARGAIRAYPRPRRDFCRPRAGAAELTRTRSQNPDEGEGVGERWRSNWGVSSPATRLLPSPSRCSTLHGEPSRARKSTGPGRRGRPGPVTIDRVRRGSLRHCGERLDHRSDDRSEHVLHTRQGHHGVDDLLEHAQVLADELGEGRLLLGRQIAHLRFQ